MDIKVSRKETRMMPYGPAEVLLSNVFDVFPVFANDDRFGGYSFEGLDRAHLIADVEILDDPRDELLDRSMFAAVKQRGQDPLDPIDGVQHAETIIGEIPVPVTMLQIQQAVNAEGPGVRVTFDTVKSGINEYLTLRFDLTNAV